MAFQALWEFTNLPIDVIKILEKDLEINFDSETQESTVGNNNINKEIRNSHNCWIPTSHWVGGFLWHYIQKANRENFLYDISHIDGETIQYTRYGEGQFYNWHGDDTLSNFYKPNFSNVNATATRNDVNYIQQKSIQQHELVRKISFSLQLSDPDDYEGGNLEFLDNDDKLFVAPRIRGSLILFDSRTRHRVCKITGGFRKSIVGWVVGPRWK